MNFLKKVRENLRDPKKKSITLLCIYFIFFIFVFIVLNGGNDSQSEVAIPELDENSSVNSEISSYEYIYKLNINNQLIEVTGTLYNNEEVFDYQNKRYYKKDNTIYVLENELIELTQPIDIDVSKYSYKFIEELINNSEFIEKTTYKDQKEKTTYNINIQKYFELNNEQIDCNLVDCVNTVIPIIVESSNNIDNVLIDLSSYYGYTYTVEISYTNINNIQDLKISTLE